MASLKTLVKGQGQKFQALCASCHLEKTELEGGSARSIESRFSPRCWELFVVGFERKLMAFEYDKGLSEVF